VHSQRSEEKLADRVLARETYRCLHCHRHHKHCNRRALLANLLLALTVVAGLALAGAYVGGGSSLRRRPTPKMKKLPPLPPPAAR
jgi:predicted hydrolase (HD superfamily)